MKNTPIEMSEQVIEAINGELSYQATLQELGRADEEDHGVSGQLVTLEAYTRKAIDAWVHSSGEQEALDTLRKVAAIAVRALEMYGCPRRKP